MKTSIKKNDTVIVTTGKDVSKTGLVLDVFPKQNKAIIKSLNISKHHVKKSVKHPAGGIITTESPINLSNLMLVCPNCKKPTKIGHKQINGKSYRFCKQCKNAIDPAKKSGN